MSEIGQPEKPSPQVIPLFPGNPTPPPLALGGAGPHDPGMDEGWRSSVDSRLGELKGALDGLRHSFTILAGAVGLIATIMVFGFGFFGVQLNQLSNKIDAIPLRLSEEFRAMRAEMAAQTSAIANSITATREAQPPVPPQIVVIPPQPAPAPKPTKP